MCLQGHKAPNFLTLYGIWTLDLHLGALSRFNKLLNKESRFLGLHPVYLGVRPTYVVKGPNEVEEKYAQHTSRVRPTYSLWVDSAKLTHLG